jgi:hypothetical protein
MPWRDRAAFLEKDPELFFPIGKTTPHFARSKRQKPSAVAATSLSPA